MCEHRSLHTATFASHPAALLPALPYCPAPAPRLPGHSSLLRARPLRAPLSLLLVCVQSGMTLSALSLCLAGDGESPRTRWTLYPARNHESHAPRHVHCAGRKSPSAWTLRDPTPICLRLKAL